MSETVTGAGKIYQQIPKIMTEIKAIAKSQDNKQQGFKFRGIDDIYNELHALLAKHKVFTSPEVLEYTREERQTKSGGVMTYTISKIRYTFFAEDGSSFQSTVIGEGSDTGDKSSNKSMAVGHKYTLLQVFCIPTKDDKDPDSGSHDLAPRGYVAPPPVIPAMALPKQPEPKKSPIQLLSELIVSKRLEEEVKNHMMKSYKVGSLRDLTSHQMLDIINDINKGLIKNQLWGEDIPMTLTTKDGTS